MNHTDTQTRPGDISLPSKPEELQALIASGSQPATYSVEDFFRNQEKVAYRISPDGTHISYMGPYERRKNLFVQKIGESAQRITQETDRDIGGYMWVNDVRLVYIKDSGGDENYQLYAVNKDGSQPKELTPFDGVRIEIIDDLEDDPNHLIIGMNKNNPQLFEPYRINIHSGDYEQLAENTDPMRPISAWLTDHDGLLRAAIRVTDGINNTLLYRDTENDEFSEVITTDFRENISPLFFDFHESHIMYVSTNHGRDKNVIARLDMRSGQEMGEPLFQHTDVDVNSLSYSRKRKVLTASAYVTDKVHRHFFDPETEQMFQWLSEQLPDYQLAVADMDKAEQHFIIRTYSDRSLGAYYLFDKSAKSLQKIADLSPWLNEADMSPMKAVTYQARDGEIIHGYLTLPVGVPAKQLPVVINPHGGPWVRDSWGFNPEVQLLASRGYAVLQMNYRGSTGYGRRFWEMSFQQWGRSMQDDITDGVNWLIKEGVADADRLAIYGGSYGGYATLAGVAFTPDLYACAVDFVGVSNLLTFLNTIPPYWKPYLSMMYTMVGDPNKPEQEEAMRQASPVNFADDITTPLFVVQGANDPRVNIDEADQIVRNLRSRDIDVPYMVKYDEGHGFRNEENRIAFYKAMLGFLGKHMGA